MKRNESDQANIIKENVIALTGGIASGKSTAAKHIASKGYPVFDADIMVGELYQDPQFSHVMQSVIPSPILNSSKTVDKEKLRNLFFARPQVKEMVEDIVHPAVKNRLIEITEQMLESCGNRLVKPIFYEASLIIEKGRQHEFNEVWLFKSDTQAQKKRIQASRNIEPETLDAILKSQWTIDDKLPFADKVISNDGTLQQLLEKVDHMLKEVDRKHEKEK